ncbi:hypothetical protein GCM10023405_47990 [Streptomonospora salina]
MSPTAKISDGHRRVKPCDAASASAQTASSIPDTTSNSQAMTPPNHAVLSLTGYGAPRPGAAGSAPPEPGNPFSKRSYSM